MTLLHCARCAETLPAKAQFCLSCGAPVGTVSQMATMDSPPSPSPARAPTPSPSSDSGSLGEAGFAPGQTFAERYRILALLGKGGMGEVYRADDLKLGQPVALKFPSLKLAQDPDLRQRFYAEVRLARQVSHPNVCRVYDVGESDGRHYLSMEYVDGEDLASLLKRIGRLPSDKALSVARELCAGLAAAHERGVLHRDLKPANVMLDGRGHARITDFGLAIPIETGTTERGRVGTPTYMAPEQLTGGTVTARTDLYALGLILYEVFTGKKPFEAKTVGERLRLMEESRPDSLTGIAGTDPAVERAILRCLEKDAAKRPASALSVAAALPGGDPLAAALAAGETPSPELVAAAGGEGALRPGVAWACLGGVIVLTFLAVLLSAHTTLYRLAPMDKAPEALAENARLILRSVGHNDPPADTAIGFDQNREYLRYIAKNDHSLKRWGNIETGAIGFWYRGSPRPLEAWMNFGGPGGIGIVYPDNPPLEQSGMTLVWLTPRGRLTSLVVVPPQVEKDPPVAPAAVDWSPLFSAAGLDPAGWTSAPPSWTPPVHSDTRAGWTGTLTERPNVPMRIEAAAYRGKPVYFELIGPWTRPARMQPYEMTTGERVGSTIFVVILLTLLVGGALLARRNFRMGRGDRKGAARLAGFGLVLWGVRWLFGVHHVPSFVELGFFMFRLGTALLFAGMLWIVYMALEPYVRRRWPATLVSWSRLMAGGFRDPLVGRDLLAGSLLGTLGVVVGRTLLAAPAWFGQAPLQPELASDRLLLGGRFLIDYAADSIVGSLVGSLGDLFLLFLFRLLLRKDWRAGAAYVLLWLALGLTGDTPLANGLTMSVIATAEVILLIHFGLLAITAEQFVLIVSTSFPLTTQISAWYAGTSFAGLALLVGLAVYAFMTSLGGRPAFGTAALEE